ncbi:right-handed parallel beta-helix repeat-containing protein [candidate division WOR-3 bacterium]|nr:right-handed parallel beta-helix repeat-containing protein [candidate division WOR-3 bacterium]
MSKSHIICIMFLLVTPLFAATWVVDTTGTEGDSLQLAIDAASADPGIDTVLLMNGTYHVAINADSGLYIRSNVVLKSQSGAPVCTLTAISEDYVDTAYHVITQAYEWVNDFVIEGLTITQGSARDSEDRGGGICLHWIGGTFGIIKDNVITENTSSYCGGGIFIDGGDTTLKFINNKIMNNTAANWGGGMAIWFSGKCTLKGDSIVSDSAGSSGGGLHFYGGGYAIVDSCVIKDNSGPGNSGGIEIWNGCSPVLTNNVIEENTAVNGKGGGIGIFDDSSPVIRNNTIKRNIADDGGGISIANSNCAPIIEDNKISGNFAGGDGGGILIYCSGGANLTPEIIGNEIMSDTARYGGGIYIYSYSSTNVSPIIRGNKITDNYTLFYGAGIYTYIYPENSLCYPSIVSDTIKYNVADGEGGGIFWYGGDFTIIDSCIIRGNIADTLSNRSGGGIAILNTDLTFSHSLVDSNIARLGGGIYISSTGSPTLDDITVTNNYATYVGGGINVGVTDNPVIKNGVISYNRAGVNAGGVYINNSHLLLDSNLIMHNECEKGGGISVYRAFPTISNNTISYNTATTKDGAGIKLLQATNCTIIHNDIIHNTAADDAGGIYMESCSLTTIIHNTISYNTAADGGGGIHIVFSPIEITNNCFSHNEAWTGGGLYINSCSPGILNLEGNVISYNTASSEAGGIYNYWSHTSLRNNTIFGNYAPTASALYNDLYGISTIEHCVFGMNINDLNDFAIYVGGDTVSIDSSFIVDNAGLARISSSTDGFSIYQSNIYFNTYQPDTEIYNLSSMQIPLTNNFWWDTTDASIAAKISGPNNHTPWEYDFVAGAPGEPLTVDSVRIYDDTTYSTLVDSIWGPDTLYIKVCGGDRSSGIYEAAIVIIKSSIYPDGIAVALMETDTNSGIYQGETYVLESVGSDEIRPDDIYQRIKVDSIADLITAYANTDTMNSYSVVYKQTSGIEEQPELPKMFSFSQNTPNPFSRQTVIKYQLPVEVRVNIRVFDLSGRCVCSLLDRVQPPGYYHITWDGEDNKGRKLQAGVYFYRIVAGKYDSIKKAIILR